MVSTTSLDGFTLLETVVATAILLTALAGIAQLFVLGTHLTRQASTSGIAVIAAQDKLEELRGLTFAYDAAGTPVTATELSPSPSSSLDHDLDATVDWIDTAGQALDRADDAALVRRWRISTIGAAPPDAIAIEVCVFKAPAGADHRAADACLATVRTRQP